MMGGIITKQHRIGALDHECAKLDALKATKGAAFDTLFLEQQKDGHNQALNALKSYSSSGEVVSLKTYASNAAPVVQAHLDMLNSMNM